LLEWTSDNEKVLKDIDKDRLAVEVKATYLMVHNLASPGKSPMSLLNLFPQRKNHPCEEYNNRVTSVMVDSEDCDLVSYCVDGLESKFQREKMMDFLSGKISWIPLLDDNHGAKNTRSQILLGACCCIMGIHLLVASMLLASVPTLSGRKRIPKDCVTIRDYTTDSTTLLITDPETILLASSFDVDVSVGSRVAMCLSLVMLRFFLLATNADNLDGIINYSNLNS
jgi:hypothetical protein